MSDSVERLNAALGGRYRIDSELGEGACMRNVGTPWARSRAALAAFVVGNLCLARPISAQPSRTFETEVHALVGIYRSHRARSGWEGSGTLAVRQTILSYAFAEAEASVGFSTFIANCPGDGTCPTYGQRVRYLTLGGGLQLPLASVRPSIGYSFGRVSREDGLADDASRMMTIGLTVDRGSRLRIGAQYRLRLEEGYESLRGGPSMTWYKSHQWLGGISVRVF